MTIRRLIALKSDTPRAAADRIRHIAAGRWAHEDTMAKFGTITPENVREALDFQARRMDELSRAGGE